MILCICVVLGSDLARTGRNLGAFYSKSKIWQGFHTNEKGFFLYACLYHATLTVLRHLPGAQHMNDLVSFANGTHKKSFSSGGLKNCHPPCALGYLYNKLSPGLQSAQANNHWLETSWSFFHLSPFAAALTRSIIIRWKKVH